VPRSYLAPGVYVEETPEGDRPIEGLATATTVIIGWAAQGPTDRAWQVTGFADFERAFGGLDRRSVLGYSVEHFFENGGREAYVVRLSGGADENVLLPNTGAFDSHFPPDLAGGVFRQLDALEHFNILAVPGETSPGVIASLQAYCRKRRAFCIVDCPEHATAEEMRTGPDPRIIGPDAMNSALYFPWLIAPDQLEAGATRRFPPSGFVAGIYARTDERRGVWKAPAGNEADVRGAIGLANVVAEVENSAINLRGINCIRGFPAGILVWGARTLHGSDRLDSDWKYVNVRRLAIFLELSIEHGLNWVVLEPNGEPLWARVRKSVHGFMTSLWRSGALTGAREQEAFFVRCDRNTMTQDDIDNGRVICVVGFAPVRPAEFVIIRIELKAGPGQ
jgi:uncharacterized protein